MRMRIDKMFHRKREWVFVVSVKFQVYLARSRKVFSLNGHLKAIMVYQQIIYSQRTNQIYKRPQCNVNNQLALHLGFVTLLNIRVFLNVVFFWSAVVVTCCWMLARRQMAASYLHLRSVCCRWESGCLWMVKPFTALNLGEFRMTPLTKMSGRLNGVKCFLI